jgi:release factor glutamine methyltransferase
MAAEARPLQAAELARELGDHGWILISLAQERETGRATSVAEAKLLGELIPAVIARAREWVGEMRTGKPLQYVTGRADFLGHTYEIVPGVLIPRPETEILVLEAVRRLRAEPPARGFEWGVGSGIIAIELLHQFPGLRMSAIDISATARTLSARNAQRVLGECSRLEIRTEWSDADRDLDFIVSNPPYLDRARTSEFDASVAQYEPAEALFAPVADLLTHYRSLAREAAVRLRSQGWLFLEVPHERALEIQAIFSDKSWKRAEALPDLTGRPRVIAIQRAVQRA